MSVLNEDFLLEVFYWCLRKKEFLEICITHLKFYYFPLEAHKSLWKVITSQYTTSNKIPTIGQLSQIFTTSDKKDRDVLVELAKIKSLSHIPDKEAILENLENFIKDSKSIEFYDKFVELYQQGQREEARGLIKKVAVDLTDFSLFRNINYYPRVFNDFEKRFENRKFEADQGNIKKKVPFSIDCLDEVSRGGLIEGDTALFLAQSGVGKTKLLKHIGVGAARRGFSVLHVQGEGLAEETLDLYDATWTGQLLADVEEANLSESTYKKLVKIINQLKVEGGDIYVHTIEKLGKDTTMFDVREVYLDIAKTNPHIELVLLDYFELFHPANNKTYRASEERQRREDLSIDMKNFALELKTRLITPIQASTVSPKSLNDPNFVMTRFDISEFKNVIKPFNFFITMNQTVDEYRNGIMRLYTDKVRKYRSKEVFTIAQDYEHERFYDRVKTLNLIETD